MQLIALGDHVLLQKIGEEDREVGGVLVPGSQQSLLTKAKILSVGSGKKLALLDLKVGDVVYYNEIESNGVSTDGTQEAAYFVRYDFIYGKIIE